MQAGGRSGGNQDLVSKSNRFFRSTDQIISMGNQIQICLILDLFKKSDF